MVTDTGTIVGRAKERHLPGACVARVVVERRLDGADDDIDALAATYHSLGRKAQTMSGDAHVTIVVEPTTEFGGSPR